MAMDTAMEMHILEMKKNKKNGMLVKYIQPVTMTEADKREDYKLKYSGLIPLSSKSK